MKRLLGITIMCGVLMMGCELFAPNPIVGTWKRVIEMLPQVNTEEMIFRADETFSLYQEQQNGFTGSLPRTETYRGTYTVKDGVLTLTVLMYAQAPDFILKEINPAGTLTYTYTIENGVNITLTDTRGSCIYNRQ